MTIDINDPRIDKILEKVEKLIALSTSSNEHEASLAMQRAQDLLARHNLDMTLVERRTGASAKGEENRLGGGLYKWQRELWGAVADLNFCRYWSIKGLTKGAKYEHRVVGRTVNVLSTRLMAEYLESTIERITRERYENNPSLYFAKAAIAFREGMADRIASRLRDRKWEREREQRAEARRQREAMSAQGVETSNALVITYADVAQQEADLIDDFLMDREPGTTARLRKEGEIASAKWRQEWEQRRAEAVERERLDRIANPEKWARIDAEAERERRREEARERRNANRRKGYSYRERKSGQPRHEDYYDGQAEGSRVGLDVQVRDGKPFKQIG